MPDISIAAEGIDKLLVGLNPHKAAGPDKFKPIVLQTLHKELAPILQFIFQRSLDTGKLPDIWKEANVSPIFKKGEKSDPSNYRPISLTCVLCKVLEHIVASTWLNTSLSWTYSMIYSMDSEKRDPARRSSSCLLMN